MKHTNCYLSICLLIAATALFTPKNLMANKMTEQEQELLRRIEAEKLELGLLKHEVFHLKKECQELRQEKQTLNVQLAQLKTTQIDKELEEIFSTNLLKTQFSGADLFAGYEQPLAIFKAALAELINETANEVLASAPFERRPSLVVTAVVTERKVVKSLGRKTGHLIKLHFVARNTNGLARGEVRTDSLEIKLGKKGRMKTESISNLKDELRRFPINTLAQKLAPLQQKSTQERLKRIQALATASQAL